MRTLWAILLATTLMATTTSVVHAADGGDPRFAVQLYGTQTHTPGNLFLSPASIRIALAMAYAGAAGETAAQMSKVLGLADGQAGHDAIAAQLARWHILAHPAATGTDLDDGKPARTDSVEMQRYYEQQLARKQIALAVTNRLWMQAGTPIVGGYLTLLKKSYGAAPATMDFIGAAEPSRQTINKWVDDQTMHKIKELIPPRMITSDTRLVVTNTIYFKAQWGAPFEERDTKPAEFHVTAKQSTPVKMMRQVEHLQWGSGAGAQLLELPYGDGDLVMDIVLPNKVDGLAAVEKALVGGALSSWLNGLHSTRVDVQLPRWKTSASLSLAEALKSLGMEKAFTLPPADFSGIDGKHDLYISAVVHQATVTVDEHGTEAAAATAVLMAAGGPPVSETPQPFVADHPFVYLIRDAKTGAILFIGRLVNPNS